MKKYKRLISVLCIGAMLCSITACGGGGSADTTTAPVTAAATTTTIDDDIDNPVDVSDLELSVTKEEVDINGAELKYIGCYDLTKAGDVKPAYKYFNENYGASITVEIVSDLEIMEKLSLYISSDQSPDLVDKRGNSFPYYITKSMYQPLDEYMDLSAPQWEGLDGYIESYAVNGKHYYYPWAYYASPRLLIYNRAKFEEMGIKDPYELYQAGEWTWDTFMKAMTDFVDKSDVDDAIGVYGTFGSGFINTTGKALIGFENGQLVNNMRTTEIERAQTFLEGLRKQGVSKLSYGDFNNVAAEPLIYGNAAFHAVGDWKLADYAKQQKKDDSLDFFFVPMPRDPSADKYYYPLDTFGYFVPSGSKNVQAACIFINCVRLSQTDPELAETTKASILKSKKYTDEQYDFWKYFQTPSNFSSDEVVMDFANSLDQTTNDDIMVPMQEDIAFDQSDEQLSWTTMRENYFQLIQDTVDNINASLQ